VKLTKQSDLIPPELWLAARVVERHTIGEDDEAEANGIAVNYLLDPDLLEYDVSHGNIKMSDRVVAMAVELIRRYTTDPNPLLRAVREMPTPPATAAEPLPDPDGILRP